MSEENQQPSSATGPAARTRSARTGVTAYDDDAGMQRRRKQQRTRERLDVTDGIAGNNAGTVEVRTAFITASGGSGDPHNDSETDSEHKDGDDGHGHGNGPRGHEAAPRDRQTDENDDQPGDGGQHGQRAGHSASDDHNRDNNRDSSEQRHDSRRSSSDDNTRGSTRDSGRHGRRQWESSRVVPPSQQPANDRQQNWWDMLTPDQQRVIAMQFFNPATTASSMAPPAATRPSTPAPPAVVQARPKMKRLDVDDFNGLASENVAAWLDTIPIAAQRQLALNDVEWSSKDLYYGVSAHLKGAAARWFRDLNLQTPVNQRTMEYLDERLRSTYGSREPVWDIQSKLVTRRQQPGELLLDYSSQLTALGAGHADLTDDFYVNAFSLGIDNPISSQLVVAARLPTLERAVAFAIQNCGRYGEGRAVNDWKAAVKAYEDRHPAAASNQPSTTDGMADELDWAKLGLNLGPEVEKPPQYNKEGQQVHGLAAVKGVGMEGSLPLAALQAIAVATRAATEHQPAVKTIAAGGKARAAKALEVKAEPDAYAPPNHAMSSTTQEQQPSNQQTHDTVSNEAQNRGGYGGQWSYGGQSQQYNLAYLHDRQQQPAVRPQGYPQQYGYPPLYNPSQQQQYFGEQLEPYERQYQGTNLPQQYGEFYQQGAYGSHGDRGRGSFGRASQGRGYGSRGRGQGGRGGGRYGPGGWTPGQGQQPGQSIEQLKAQTMCHYCGKKGHWQRECPERLAEVEERARARVFQAQQRQPRTQTTPSAPAQPAASSSTAGNAQRQ